MKKILRNIFICWMSIQCGVFYSSTCNGQVKDIDEVVYNTVRIGKQLWTIENTIVSHFRNGDTIPQAYNLEEWIKAGEERRPVFCYYKFDSLYNLRYGKLYNWFAAMDPRGFAPKGWHLPTDDDWKLLIEELGGENIAGEKMKSDKGWTAYVDRKGNGSNYSEFSGLPGGCLLFKDELTGFYNMGNNGFWWSSTAVDSVSAKIWCRSLGYDNKNISRFSTSVKSGLSVRFVRD